MERRKFTREFKLEAVRLIKERGVSYAQASQDLSVHQSQLRSCVGCTPRSCAACTYETPRSLISRTASSLNSRVNFRLSMTHLQFHQST